jgi:CheY-like chemotaxis protein
LYILIIEDNKLNQIVLNDLIKIKFPDIKVMIVDSGVEALSLECSKFDFILTDITMFPIDGFTVYSELRENYGYKKPIIAVTARAVDGDMEKILMHGFNDYVSVPIDSKKLYSTLSKYMGDET